MDILKRAGGRHPKTTREVSLLFSSFWTSSSWRWSCNRCAILMSKNHPKEVGVFPLGCLKNMCIIWENSGKHIYIYIYALYAQIYEILTRCFDLPMLQTNPWKKPPHEICSRFCWLKESNGTPADPLFAWRNTRLFIRCLCTVHSI